MKLEDQVCSLELAKRLKELGVTQKSAFYWATSEVKCGTVSGELDLELSNYASGDYDNCSAFTVAELGVALPKSIPGKNRDTLFFEQGYNGKGEPLVNFTASETEEYYAEQIGFEGDTEANARSAMLCHLLENKIISLEEVNERLKGVRG